MSSENPASRLITTKDSPQFQLPASVLGLALSEGSVVKEHEVTKSDTKISDNTAICRTQNNVITLRSVSRRYKNKPTNGESDSHSVNMTDSSHFVSLV